VSVANTKVAFIGGGNMSQAIVGGLLAEGHAARDLQVVEPNAAARAKLEAMGVAAVAACTDRVLTADAIVLAVKPQVMREALAPLAGKLGTQLVISIAAGIRTVDLSRWLGDGGGAGYTRIVRAMPNTPALIRAGITGLFAMPALSAGDKARAENLLRAVGKTAWFEHESMLDTVTAVSGSGPAYVFYFIEALEEAARDMGFDAEAAHLFAIETFAGGARLAAESHDSPAVLRANVTSRRGTTERAIETFDAAALKQKFMDGVKAAAARSAELGVEFGRDA
jgi:pyrroline-5-carboxylate reductase